MTSLLLISKFPLETPATESLQFFIATEKQKNSKIFLYFMQQSGTLNQENPPSTKKFLYLPPKNISSKEKILSLFERPNNLAHTKILILIFSDILIAFMAKLLLFLNFFSLERSSYLLRAFFVNFVLFNNIYLMNL